MIIYDNVFPCHRRMVIPWMAIRFGNGPMAISRDLSMCASLVRQIGKHLIKLRCGTGTGIDWYDLRISADLFSTWTETLSNSLTQQINWLRPSLLLTVLTSRIPTFGLKMVKVYFPLLTSALSRCFTTGTPKSHVLQVGEDVLYICIYRVLLVSTSYYIYLYV